MTPKSFSIKIAYPVVNEKNSITGQQPHPAGKFLATLCKIRYLDEKHFRLTVTLF